MQDQGTTFDNHFVSVSLCCPSRVATLRGQYAHNSGIFGNGGANGGFGTTYAKGLESSTVATWLQDAGYRTALIGKYLNGYPTGAPSPTYIPPGWTRWFSPNGGNPYSEYDYSLNENGTTVNYGHTDADYLVDVVSNKAATFITNTTKSFPNKPFFLYLTPYVAQRPGDAAVAVRRRVSWRAGAAHTVVQRARRQRQAWLAPGQAPLTTKQIQGIDVLYRKRLQTMLAVEDLVESVIDTLTSTGQLANTYIFFSSDNGFHQGQHRLDSGKNTAYDEDLYVPLIVRGPGVPAARRHEDHGQRRLRRDLGGARGRGAGVVRRRAPVARTRGMTCD